MKKSKKNIRMNVKRKGFGGIFAGRLPWALIIAALLCAVYAYIIISTFPSVFGSGAENMAAMVENFMNEDSENYGSEGQEERFIGITRFNSSDNVIPLSPIHESFAARLEDDDGNVLADGSEIGVLFIREDNKISNPQEFFYCDKSAYDKINARIAELEKTAPLKNHSRYDYSVTSVYIDRANKKFVPAEGVITYMNSEDDYFESLETVDVENFTFDTGDTGGMELLTDNFGGGRLYGFPDGSEIKALLDTSSRSYFNNNTEFGKSLFRSSSKIRAIDGKIYTLHVAVLTDVRELQTQYIITGCIVITAIAIVITLLMSWRTSIVYKSHYAMEDYRREMTNTLAHDLKSPLMAISGCAEIIRNGCDTERAVKYSETIMSNVNSMNDMISNVLELAKLEGGRAPSKETIDLKQLTSEAVERYRAELTEHNISCENSGVGSIKADKQMMPQVIDNLLSNAVKYTPDGGSIKLETSDKALTVTNDSSEELPAGIPAEELWKPFVKGDSARSAEMGSGMGLSIVRGICDAHGFATELEAKDGRFKVTIKFR